MSSQSVFVFGRCSTPESERVFSIQPVSAAAYSRVEALKLWISSDTVRFGFMSVVQTNAAGWFPRVWRGDGEVVWLVPYSGVIGSLISSVKFLGLALEIKRCSTLLIYNPLPEYLLAIIWLKLNKVRVLLDLEDLPLFGHTGWHENFCRCSWRLYQRLVPTAIVANEFIKEMAGCSDATVFFGVQKPDDYSAMQYSRLRKPYRLIVSGTLGVDQRIDLLIEALKNQTFKSNFEVILTGSATSSFAVLAPKFKNVKVALDLTHAEYVNFLTTVDVGWVIRDTRSDYAVTTFPSKVIEFVNRGVLVATNDPQIATLLDGNVVFIDCNLNVVESIDTLLTVLSDLTARRRKAELARAVLAKKLELPGSFVKSVFA